MTDKKETVFEQLRKLDIWEHVEKKNGFNYLSWAWAVEQMFMFDDEAEFNFPEREIFPDGTVMIYCEVKIKGKTKRGFLPVMDYKNSPIRNPNARQISDNMQRCLVKTIALHGLGLGLYAGEDIPKSIEEVQTEVIAEAMQPPSKNLDRETQENAHKTALNMLSDASDIDQLQKIWKAHYKQWMKLDADLWSDIEQKKDECKDELNGKLV